MSNEVKQIGSGLDNFETEEVGAATQGTATSETVQQAMGNQLPKLPKLEVKHQGAVIFKEKDGAERTFQKLEGVVVAYSYHNSFFGVAFEQREQGQRPKCYSNDGVMISNNAPEPQAASCAVCPRNRDGERGSETRKAAFEKDRKTECCNNYLSLIMIVKDQGEIPFRVQFPNSSFKTWAAYTQEIANMGKFQPHEVATSVTLTNKKQRGGSAAYSEGTFKMIAPLKVEIRPAFAERNEFWTNYLSAKDSEVGAEGGEDNAGTAADAVKRAKAAEEAVKAGEQQAAL